ncbi:MAG: hypothetical protein KGJ89_03955 [Patescibacteria group bacterium]|nr:hypothetical protein [Patescibacteria group bacterium]MDE2015279.1 hypothetical protein [Patescibacteria group bacterium]MDE2227085.1 hypothetical protein [Patescibacteria group bacterium]
MAGEIQTFLTGFSTLSGGTRDKVKNITRADRPWQVSMKYPEPGKCGLCNKDDETKYIPGPGWKSFQNAFTPFPYHRILIPDVCWDEEKLRSLGGKETLRTALRYARNEILRTRGNMLPMWIFTHIGYGAGQNFPHHHWHICEAPTQPKNIFTRLWHDLVGDVIILTKEAKCILNTSENFIISLYGRRAGQVVIFSKRRLSHYFPIVKASDLLEDKSLRTELLDETCAVVELFNRKFNYPDYCLFFGINRESEWYVRYTPILNNWGGSEFAALDFDTPFVLPWPHEKTLEFLKS